MLEVSALREVSSSPAVSALLEVVGAIECADAELVDGAIECADAEHVVGAIECVVGAIECADVVVTELVADGGPNTELGAGIIDRPSSGALAAADAQEDARASAGVPADPGTVAAECTAAPAGANDAAVQNECDDIVLPWNWRADLQLPSNWPALESDADEENLPSAEQSWPAVDDEHWPAADEHGPTADDERWPERQNWPGWQHWLAADERWREWQNWPTAVDEHGPTAYDRWAEWQHWPAADDDSAEANDWQAKRRRIIDDLCGCLESLEEP